MEPEKLILDLLSKEFRKRRKWDIFFGVTNVLLALAAVLISIYAMSKINK